MYQWMMGRVGLQVGLAILLLVVLAAAGVGMNAAIAGDGEQVMIVDSHGRYVEVPCPPERIVVVNSNILELLYALGAGESIVGTAEASHFPPQARELPQVGRAFAPNIERILELQPDIVFGYGDFMREDLARQIEKAGVPLVLLDGFKLETIVQDVKTLGLILDRREEASAYVSYIQGSRDLIAERTADLDPQERVAIYWETRGEYSTAGPGSAGSEMINTVRGVNLAGGEPIPHPRVSNEWVLERDPKVIIKAISSSVPSGYGAGAGDMAAIWSEMVNRTGWDHLQAVREGRLYIMANEITTSPRGSIVGLLHLARWLYPERFEDVDPKDLHREVLDTFYGLDYEGVWVYGGP